MSGAHQAMDCGGHRDPSRGPHELGKAPLQALILWQGLPGQAVVQASLTAWMQVGEISHTHDGGINKEIGNTYN
jgi:hypothetical protein